MNEGRTVFAQLFGWPNYYLLFLVRAGHLKLLGKPAQNARKRFATVEIERMSCDPEWLDKANCGWISLSNAVAYVRTDTISPGALDPDGSGLPIAWELQNFGHTGVDPNADPDGDGMNNMQEYLADTDPNNAGSVLQITAESFSAGGTSATLTWNSVPTRYYYLQKALNLNSNIWTDSGLGLVSPSAAATTTAGFADTNAPVRFYRVEAVRPLTP